jgi:hypothetical protein
MMKWLNADAPPSSNSSVNEPRELQLFVVLLEPDPMFSTERAYSPLPATLPVVVVVSAPVVPELVPAVSDDGVPPPESFNSCRVQVTRVRIEVPAIELVNAGAASDPAATFSQIADTELVATISWVLVHPVVPAASAVAAAELDPNAVTIATSLLLAVRFWPVPHAPVTVIVPVPEVVCAGAAGVPTWLTDISQPHLKYRR